ncbi:unnamed protein product [Pylaiella littoralis]
MTTIRAEAQIQVDIQTTMIRTATGSLVKMTARMAPVVLVLAYQMSFVTHARHQPLKLPLRSLQHDAHRRRLRCIGEL